MIRDYEIKKIHLWERFLLLFIKPSYIYNRDGKIYTKEKYKKMFKKTYMLNRNISVRSKLWKKLK